MEEKEVRSELDFGVPKIWMPDNGDRIREQRAWSMEHGARTGAPINIFYPYWAGGSKWEELRYSLRSLDKNFKEDFVVWIVGDKPDWLKTCCGLQVSGCEYKSMEQGARSIEHGAWSREHGARSREHGAGAEGLKDRRTDCIFHIPYRRDDSRSSLWNTTRMMEVFMKYANCTNFSELHEEGITEQGAKSMGIGADLFVRMNDDIYLIGERMLEDLMVTRMVRMPEEVKSMTSGGAIWRKQALNTYLALTDLDYAGYLTETHCPEVYSIRNLQLIYQAYELPESELLPSTLYFNVFPYERQMIDRKAERALFYGAENEFSYSSLQVAQKCRDKYFLNHNDEGLNDELKQFIMEMFPEKSRWEK